MSKILIIGGTSGIGLATAELMAREHTVIEQYIPSKTVLDVRSSSDTRSYIRNNGPFDYIMYSVGVNELSWMSSRRIDLVMDDAFLVNCAGFVTVLGEHKRLFPEAGFSAVAISSDAGQIPMRGSISYCVSKAALNMAVRVAARELAPLCRVNAIAPGMVEGTAMTEYIDKTIPKFRGWTPEYAREYERQGTPTGRRATLTEIAQAVVWVLLGPDQMTGAIISVNGGR